MAEPSDAPTPTPASQETPRVRPRRSRRRLDRSLAVFALLLLGLAAGFCWLGWRSVEQEHMFRLEAMHRRAREWVTRQVDGVAGSLERLRSLESLRNYYEFQPTYLPESLTSESLAFQNNALVRQSGDSRIVGRFEWERGPKGPHLSARVLRDDRGDLRQALRSVYGDALRRRLSGANQLARGPGWQTRTHPLRVIAANEERGQLLESQAREETRTQERTGEGGRIVEAESAYLEGFLRRVGTGTVGVHYGPFRYLAAPDAAKVGAPLLAWRLVWIPASHATLREVRHDRWLLQGYMLDPRGAFPTDWRTRDGIEMVRGDSPELGNGLVDINAHLGEALGADTAALAGQPAWRHRGLSLIGRVDVGSALAQRRKTLGRFLLLVVGLLSLVAVGFVLLWRGVRREVALARRKEDFIAAITHELKTPLTGIRMYADMLKAGWVSSPEAAQGYAGKILDESARLGHLVDQVLDLAALERGVARINATLGDLGEAVVEATKLMEARAGEAGVALACEVEPDLPLVLFDPRLVRPLVLNLLDNAIKYSERASEKSVRVHIRRDGERVVLEVADKGIGIPAHIRRHVFEPFQRAGGELTRDAPGVGIGLALVKRYAEAHRARISIDSEEGRGTTVTVRFPPAP